jgi:hypothetical protein
MTAYEGNTMATDLNDPIDDIFGNAGTEPRQPVKPLPVGYTAPHDLFVEGCRKCGGTGFWRVGYQCFACKGKGKRSFKTSPQARQNAKTGAATRKANTEAGNLEAFAKAFPDIWQWMDGNSFPFAVSLRESVAKWGDLTAGQLDGARRCIAKRNAAIAAKTATVAAAPSIDIGRIETAFAIAATSGLKRPKLRIAGFTFSPAPTTGRNAGAIYVKRGQDYLGKVQGGKLVCIGGVSDETRNTVISIAANPAEAAKLHGMQTGTCSICGAELTNGESIKRGIGPICASRFGW